jgi:hypothetical protein
VYRFNRGQNHMDLDGSWFDLEAGLATSAAAGGGQTTVLCTAGVLSGMLDQVPAAEAADLACWSPAAARRVIDEAGLTARESDMVLGSNARTVLNLETLDRPRGHH